MKVMAIGSFVKPLTPEQRQQVMPNEVPATLKHYLDGKIEQFWFRQDAPGVIFLMNVEIGRAGEVDDGGAATRDRRLREVRLLAGRPARPAWPAPSGQVRRC